jgi:hypothetical protein
VRRSQPARAQGDAAGDRAEKRKQQRAELRKALRGAETELAVVRSQLAAAQAALADPSGLGYLFVVTYGRSGSTLLAGMLSSIPGYLILGEYELSQYHMFQFDGHTVEKRDTQAQWSTQPGHAWTGIEGYDEAVALQRIRSLLTATLLRPEPTTRVVGYKEIRWWYPDVREYVQFLRAVFPGARFVLNSRDHAAVARSKWWTDTEDPMAELARLETILEGLGEQLGDAAFHVRYDEYAADVNALRPLFAWLGEPFDEAAVSEVAARRHSF